MNEAPASVIIPQQENQANKSSSMSSKKQSPPTAEAPVKGHLRKAQKAMEQALAKKIESNNKGYEIMQKMGYQDGTGLGKWGDGIREPIGFKLKLDRKGLAEQTERMREAKKKRQPAQGKAKASETPEKSNESDAAHSGMSSPATLKGKQSPTTKDTTAKTHQKQEPPSPPVRKHSPIRAPQQSQSPRNEKAAAVPSSKPTPTPTPTPAPTTGANTNRKNSQGTKQAAAAANKYKWAFAASPATPDQLWQLSKQFREEITWLKLRLSAEAERGNELIVAKIIAKTQPIAERTFEFIRTEIVGWIGKYQFEKMITPIFHSMANHLSHITIVCEDVYAYNCLEQCVHDISDTRTKGPIVLVRLPSITPLLYCYSAVYEGIIRDPYVFLSQVKLHRSQIISDRWIVVSHRVHTVERETHFVFIIDEPSVLVLTYYYNNNMFICMQKVAFVNRGRVPPDNHID